MLVLSRHVGEELYLSLPNGTEIVVKVQSLTQGRVRLVVAAPRVVQIVRGELFDLDTLTAKRRAAGMLQIHTDTEGDRS